MLTNLNTNHWAVSKSKVVGSILRECMDNAPWMHFLDKSFCINVIAQIMTPSDIGGTNKKESPVPKSCHCQYCYIKLLKQLDCGFIWCMKIKDYFPEFCVAGVFHYVKSCFGWYSGNIRLSALVSLSLRILLFQSEPVPGFAPLCQLLLR